MASRPLSLLQTNSKKRRNSKTKTDRRQTSKPTLNFESRLLPSPVRLLFKWLLVCLIHARAPAKESGPTVHAFLRSILATTTRAMGAVHGVYLKYVGLSALSYVGYACMMGTSAEPEPFLSSQNIRGLAAVSPEIANSMSFWRLVWASIFGYSALLNGIISILFRLEWGMGLIGKDPKTGQIPRWSYVLFFPFHLPTMLYTHIHTRHGQYKAKTENGETKRKVPVATQVQPGFWVGGCYAHELERDWGGIIDLTVEFPERCISHTESYLLIPTWDGVPATPELLEEAANFSVEARKKGDVIVHCAHGRGRSTTVMCACLVKAGLYSTWQEAFEKGIKPGRPVCKLNSKMRKALASWQARHVDGKKGQ